MRKTISSGRVAAMAALVALFVVIYLVFLYKLQIIEGEKYYNQSNEITSEERTVTAARGNILDRYGRVLVSNKECYNLKIDTVKLFSNADPNAVISPAFALNSSLPNFSIFSANSRASLCNFSCLA